jgi:hypothetical protein
MRVLVRSSRCGDGGAAGCGDCFFFFSLSSSSLFLLLNMVVGSSSFVHHGLLQMI